MRERESEKHDKVKGEIVFGGGGGGGKGLGMGKRER